MMRDRIGETSMSVRVSLARTAAFAMLYALAAVVGRLTVIANTKLSMVWPAAGVLVVWFCAQRAARCRWADYAAMAVSTVVVTIATGCSLRMAVVFVLASAAHVGLFLVLFRRWQPHMWGAGGDQPLRHLRELWSLLAVAGLSNALGAVVGAGGIWMVSNHFALTDALVWLARNTVSDLLVATVGLTLSFGTRYRRATDAAGVGAGTAERIALVLCSVAAYGIGFGYNRGVPVTFALIVLSIWAGLRIPTRFVVVHNLVLGMAAIFFTLLGKGPFIVVTDLPARALIAQLYVGVIALVGLVLALGRDERVTLTRSLEREKSQLAAQRERADQRAELLSAILDSMADGVSVIDAQGRVVMRNEATARILSGRVSPGDRVADLAHYGMVALDGAPLARDESAYARAITSQEVVSQDVLVRTEGVAGEKIVTVTATPLTGEDGQPRVVLVLHDVTAERRHRDELTNFAGVVAHDLQSPLTIVEAWGSIAADAVESGATEVAGDGIGRIRRAATRMRNLINDLLMYTTARDAALSPEALPLDALVNDIAVARVDAAMAAGAPVPRFTIETLPNVLGDACLVRQLLDNLMGNAIKYTAPEVTPHVTVTARASGQDHTEITITDNGIGIPAGQHEAIFGNFHRAHSTAGYAGTGLGLAICRRIVQRHGGTIRAEDNPSGGTRFVFDLPQRALQENQASR